MPGIVRHMLLIDEYLSATPQGLGDGGGGTTGRGQGWGGQGWRTRGGGQPCLDKSWFSLTVLGLNIIIIC